MRKILLPLLLLLLALPVWADEHQMLLQRAFMYTQSRQIDKAAEIYRAMLDKNPTDRDALAPWLYMLVNTRRYDEAEKTLGRYGGCLTDLERLCWQVELAVRNNRPEEADDLADAYLKAHPGEINAYGSLGQRFLQTAQYDRAVEIYTKARKVSGDKRLFAYDLGTCYELSGRLALAQEEYVQHLERNPAYLNYLQNRLVELAGRDKKMPRLLATRAELSNTPEVWELAARVLTATGDPQAALPWFARLEETKLLQFARELAAAGKLQVAEAAYQGYLARSHDVAATDDARVELARLLLADNRNAEARTLLEAVYNSPVQTDPKQRWRSKAGRLCRETLADIALDDHDPALAAHYLQQARDYVFNQGERRDIDLRIAYLQLMAGSTAPAGQNLEGLLKDEPRDTPTYKKGLYYLWVARSMEASPMADTLLADLLFSAPDYEKTRQTLLIHNLLAALDPDTRSRFWLAFKDNELHNRTAAFTCLDSLAAKSEAFAILAGDWAAAAGQTELARGYYQRTYQDEFYRQYARLQFLSLAPDTPERAAQLSDFLAQNPDSLLAPAFRELLYHSQGNLP